MIRLFIKIFGNTVLIILVSISFQCFILQMVVTRSGREVKISKQDVDKKEVHLVTGGGGYAGFWLGRRLASKGHRVLVVDVREPVWTLQENMEFHMVCLFSMIYMFQSFILFASFESFIHINFTLYLYTKRDRVTCIVIQKKMHNSLIAFFIIYLYFIVIVKVKKQ